MDIDVGHGISCEEDITVCTNIHPTNNEGKDENLEKPHLNP
jgi:hypothetical protein